MIKLSSLGSKVLIENGSEDPYTMDVEHMDFTITDSTHVSFDALGGVPIPISQLEIEGSTPANIGAFKTAIASVFPNAGGSATPTVINIEYAELLTAITGETLTTGATYQITDRGDRGLYFVAIADNELSRTGIRKMLCPSFYGVGSGFDNTWIGVWNATKNPNSSELAIWGGLVFESVTGNIGTATTDILLDVVNWAVVPKASFANGEYIEMQFGVSYDVENDWIERQWDGSGNELGNAFALSGGSLNFCDWSDWNLETAGVAFFDNKCWGVFNNSNAGGVFGNKVAGTIKNNSNASDISNNILTAEISGNSNNGTISNNKNSGVSGNSNGGAINQNNNLGAVANNSNTGAIFDNINFGPIDGNSNAGAINDNNTDAILNNSNVGNIEYNKNNGVIENCSSGANPCNIHHNINNGNIEGTFATHVTDTIVNKS